MRLTMKGATAKNTRYADKPNEDLFFFDEATGFAMMLDGVSRDRENGIYPSPSPACRADNAFADAAQAVFLKKNGAAPADRLKAAVYAGNMAVAAANEGFPSPFLPGTVGVLALFAEHKLHYAYIGDSNGILISNGTLSYFTTPQTAEVHRRRKEFTSDEIRAVICNNPSHPCGYGVWNGMPSAAEFLRVGELPLSAGDRVLLCTDGIDPFLASLSDAALAAMDADTLISQAMAYMMPEGYMDDRTAIVINILDV